MTSQLRTIPPVPGKPRLSWWPPRDRAGNALGRIGRPVFRTRRELHELRGTVRELEYIQQSLLGTVDRLLEVSAIIMEGRAGDGGNLPT